jgi:hypothetical protein
MSNSTSSSTSTPRIQCCSCRDLYPARIYGGEYQPTCEECLYACSGHKHCDKGVINYYMPIDVEGYRVCLDCEPAWIQSRNGAQRDFHPVGGVSCFTCDKKFSTPYSKEVQFFPLDGKISYFCKNDKCAHRDEIEKVKAIKMNSSSTTSSKRPLEDKNDDESSHTSKKLKVEESDNRPAFSMLETIKKYLAEWRVNFKSVNWNKCSDLFCEWQERNKQHINQESEFQQILAYFMDRCDRSCDRNDDNSYEIQLLMDELIDCGPNHIQERQQSFRKALHLWASCNNKTDVTNCWKNLKLHVSYMKPLISQRHGFHYHSIQDDSYHSSDGPAFNFDKYFDL